MERFKTAHTQYPRRPSRDPGLFLGQVVTEQAAAEQMHLPTILNRMSKGLPVSNVVQRSGFFGDLTTMPSDLHSAMNMVTSARSDFDALPAAVRRRFSNDPLKLLEFLNNKDNLAEAIKLGIVPSTEPVKVVTTDPPADPVE